MDSPASPSPALNSTARRSLPAWAAATLGFVLAASLALTAWICGLFPSAAPAGLAPTPSALSAPASPGPQPFAGGVAGPPQAPSPPIPRAGSSASLPPPSAPLYAAYPPPPLAACASCGRVASVRAVREATRPSGWGAVAGAVGGGLLGSAFGHGNGRAATVVLGAAGGGLAGNAIEKRMSSRTVWVMGVRMDDGRWRQETFAQPPPFSIGERVRYGRGGFFRD